MDQAPRENSDNEEQGVLLYQDYHHDSSDEEVENSSTTQEDPREEPKNEALSTGQSFSLFGSSFSLTQLFEGRSSADPNDAQDRVDDDGREHHHSLSQLVGSFISAGIHLDTNSIDEVNLDGHVEEVPGGVFARTQSLSRLFGNDSVSEGLDLPLISPKLLQAAGRRPWFGKSVEEENRCVHRALNVTILTSAVLFALFSVFIIDYQHWHEWSFFDIVKNTLADNWSAYEGALEKHPIRTKMIISGCVYTLGDCIAQCYEGVSVLDVIRLRAFRSGLVGFLLHGSLSHAYYHFCEWLFPWQGWWVVPLKVAFDQTIWSGVWNSIYYVMLGLLRFESPLSIIHQLRATFFPLITAGWKLWPFAHVITYGVIPVEQRLAWVDLVELIWVIILSMYSNKEKLTPAADKLDLEKNGMYVAAEEA